MARLPQARRPFPAPWGRLPAAVALLLSLAACRPSEPPPTDIFGSPAAPATIQAAQPTPTATALPSPTPRQAPALPATPVPEAQPGEGLAARSSAGANWHRWDNPLLPSPRFFPGMCRHPLSGSLMLFGGTGVWEGYLNDLWLLQEDGWYWLEAPGPAPQPRTSPAMSYDEERRVVVLFGGAGDNGAFGDTWLFDGTGWTEQHPPSSPSPRTAMVMAYDATRKQTVLFGGLFAHGMDGTYLGDTWIWDGTTWAPRAAANSPPPCTSACMVYDVARGASSCSVGGTKAVPSRAPGPGMAPLGSSDGPPTVHLQGCMPAWRTTSRGRRWCCSGGWLTGRRRTTPGCGMAAIGRRYNRRRARPWR